MALACLQHHARPDEIRERERALRGSRAVVDQAGCRDDVSEGPRGQDVQLQSFVRGARRLERDVGDAVLGEHARRVPPEAAANGAVSRQARHVTFPRRGRPVFGDDRHFCPTPTPRR